LRHNGRRRIATVQRFALVSSLGADLKYALRLFVRNPVFTGAAVIALGLAIGANVTVFTLANAFLFKNLPFDDSELVVYVSSTNFTRPGSIRGVSYPDFLDFREQARSLDALGALTTCTVDVSDGTGFPERYRCAQLMAAAFGVIGQTPVVGRDFREDDERPGAPAVAILSDRLWQSRYARDRGIVGRLIRINEVPTEVIGAMGPGVTFPGATDLWTPLVRTPALQQRSARTLTLFGRLPRHGSIRSARAELTVIASRLAAQYPDTNKDIGVVVQNFNDRFNNNDTSRLFVALLWAVGFVLLIACANIANLLLARAVGRSREISIRAGLGANRARIIQQLLVESTLLAGLGAVAGSVLGVWGIRVFDAALVPAVKPPYIDFSIDGRVLAYLASITMVTGILFGLAPALQLSRLDLNTFVKEGGVTGRSRRARFLSGALVVVEMSLAVVLLAGAGLMIRSLVNTSRAEIGVEATHVLSMNMNLRSARYPRVESHVQFYDTLKARLEALPTIEAAAVASDLPAESPDTFMYELEGAPQVHAERRPEVAGLIVGEDYFRVMGVSPRSGREFARTDLPGSLPVVVVSEMFAKQSWPGQDPLGKRMRLLSTADGAPRGAAPVPGPWLAVVGVFPDILQDDESFEMSSVIYLPYRQRPLRGPEFVVRTRVPPATTAEAIRREVQALDADLAVRTLRPLEESFWLRNWRYRVFGSMFLIFATIALVLACVGLYAVIAQSVSQRTREIGVRMTLGATSATILRLVFGQGMLQLAAGVLIGLAGALAAARVLSAMLVGVTPSDPWTFGGVTLLLVLAGAIGCAIPARRATRVDPVIALRND